MPRPARAVLLALVCVLALVQVPSAPAQESGAESGTDMSRCERPLQLQGIGPACFLRPGLYEVFGPSGESLGYTHGADPACAGCEEPVAASTGSTPLCVSATPNTYYVHVIYARASDDTDRYSTMLPTIRALVGQANQLVYDAGVATGTGLDIRVLCNAGQVAVENLALPTAMASATFSTIVSDIRAMGHNDGKQKYWVFYDDAGACSCAGTGHIYMDETAGVTNNNNGNQASMFAVSFASATVRTWLHELGHNLGAVQDSAPFSTRAGHCIDGRDTMCYNDGGSNASGYSTSYCATEVFDCNKNTYCHANPPAGSWLATHWNVCGANQRFLHRSGTNAAPTMQALSCTPTNPNEGQTVTCSFRAADPGDDVSYNVSWGDGSPIARIPASGLVASNVTQNATHVYARGGSFTVNVTATDDDAFPLTSAPASTTLNVVEVNTAPVLPSISCTSSTLQPGATASCTFNASDDSTGVRYTVQWGDGQTTTVPASGYVTPGVSRSASHAFAAPGNYTVNVTAADNATPSLSSATRSAVVRVANNAPAMQSLSCNGSVQVNTSLTCSFHAADDSSGVRYTIEWGDGQTSLVPATGYVAPGTARSASHNYTAAGNFTVRVTATDNASTPLTSAPRNASVAVTSDATPPELTIGTPASGYLYMGCGVEQQKQTAGVLFVQRGCVRAAASDASAIARVEVRSASGEVLATDVSAPYTLEFLVPTTGLGVAYDVVAIDRWGNQATIRFLADSLAASLP